MMKLRKIAALSLLATSLVFANGCFLFVGAAGAGAGAVWYYGALKSTEETGHKAVHAAAKQALEQLEIPVQTSSVDATAGTIEGETADNKQVVISVKHLTENTTELTIRVGLTDETRARMIYNKIKANLPGVDGSAEQ